MSVSIEIITINCIFTSHSQISYLEVSIFSIPYEISVDLFIIDNKS